MTYREKFDKAVSHINRDGLSNLLNWLENETDFFSAPASTNFHGNYEGGLLEHTVNVLEYALTLFNFTQKRSSDNIEHLKESLIISALFHDICKVNCYSKEEKWTKNSKNQWVSYKGWVYKDEFPMGHAEKSVYLINKHMQLNDIEALAIRWHMGPYETGVAIEGPTKWSYSAASDRLLVRLLHSADLMASAIEKSIDYKALASK